MGRRTKGAFTKNSSFFPCFFSHTLSLICAKKTQHKLYSRFLYDYELQLINAESVVLLTNEVISHTDNGAV